MSLFLLVNLFVMDTLIRCNKEECNTEEIYCPFIRNNIFFNLLIADNPADGIENIVVEINFYAKKWLFSGSYL